MHEAVAPGAQAEGPGPTLRVARHRCVAPQAGRPRAEDPETVICIRTHLSAGPSREPGVVARKAISTRFDGLDNARCRVPDGERYGLGSNETGGRNARPTA